MGFEMLTDMFAQPEEFDLLPYSALWHISSHRNLLRNRQFWTKLLGRDLLNA